MGKETSRWEKPTVAQNGDEGREGQPQRFMYQVSSTSFWLWGEVFYQFYLASRRNTQHCHTHRSNALLSWQAGLRILFDP